MKNFITRSATALLYVLLLLSAIWYGPWSFVILLFFVSFFTQLEFYRLVQCPKKKILVTIFTALAGAYLVLASFMIYQWGADRFLVHPLIPYLFCLVCISIAQVFIKSENSFPYWANLIMGQIYVALPISLLIGISYLQNGIYDVIPLFALFAFIWANDTGAYLIGSTLGKHRLCPKISPLKSWEGFWGGVSASLLISLLAAYFLPSYTLFEWLGMSVIISLSATAGDLCESLLKRTFQVKDSGKSLPGHGGLLDRFDSLLVAAPFLLIYLSLIR